MILDTLIFITVLGIIFLFNSIIDDLEELKVTAICILTFHVVFGWGVIGCSLYNYSEEIIQTPIEVVKGKHVCVLVFKTKTFIIKDYELEKINDKSIYYYKIAYNIYNSIIDTTLIIK